MNKFTFIVNYKGGTYIDQVQSYDVINACYMWSLSMITIVTDVNQFSKSFSNDIIELPPIPIENTPGVWGWMVGSGREKMIIHIIIGIFFGCAHCHVSRLLRFGDREKCSDPFSHKKFSMNCN